MTLQERFRQKAGKAAFLTLDDKPAITAYLKEGGWLKEGESVKSIAKPGEGNMNFVARITTNRRSFILKQSRPWVEKFPDIEAPLERVLVEGRFYAKAQEGPLLEELSPHLLGEDEENYTLLLEDLGEGADFTYLYRIDRHLVAGELDAFITFLNHLHRLPYDESFPENMALRQLNHEHIFVYPYLEDNGFDLDSVQDGLQARAMPYKTDAALKEKLSALGEVYLGSGETLLHGDFYPGSWLKTEDGVRVIDPEFAFYGQAEFDLGVFLAHLRMSQAKEALLEKALADYNAPDGFDEELFHAFTGVEMLRRIIGLAQLPLQLGLSQKEQLLKEGRAMLMAWAP